MPADIQQAYQSALRSDLNTFTDKTLTHLMGAANYLPNWHVRAITAQLQRMIDGDCRFAIVLVPPRMGKSLICSVALPAFLMMRDPSCKIMALSYASHLGEKLHNQTRNVLRSPWCRSLNPELKFAAKKSELTLRDTGTVIETTKGGYRYAPSFGGTIRGEGADWTIIDDPMGTTAASSEAERKRAIDTFQEAIRSRLNSKNGRILLVMQRVHLNDLAGHLMELGGYEVLKIPAIAEEDTSYDVGNGEQYFRPKGNLIDNRRFDMAEMGLLRRDLGTDAFEAQYQQNPALPDGTIFKRKWLRFVDELPDFEHVVVSADIAGSEERGDYSVFLVWGIRDGIWYLTKIYRRRLDFADLISLMRQVDHDHEPDLILVEKNGLGASFYGRLKELGYRNIDAVSMRESKQDRAHAITPLLEQGKVAILSSIAGREILLDELLTFPSSKHDDQVDAFTLPLHRHLDIKRVLRACHREKRKGTANGSAGQNPVQRAPYIQRSGFTNHYAERNRGNPFLG